ncbi:MAG: hypothetical protein NTW61_03720 [Candidatus Melainabacteria bacterium]|nr:hypothetical protein [Candidatus Melainabacteria bacterium]
MITITSQAKMVLRKVKVNERLLFKTALADIAMDPTEDRSEITFLSTRGKHDAYRYRTTVGMVMYLVENMKKEVIVIDVQPFRR